MVGSLTPEAIPRLSDIVTAPDRDAAYRQLLAGEPVRRVRNLDGTVIWLVAGYAEIVQVLTDSRFSNDLSRAGDGRDPALAFPEDLRRYLGFALAANDPPGHTRLRKALSQEFTARRMADLRPRVETFADELITGMIHTARRSGRVDLSASFASQLPIRVIGGLLGVPADDEPEWLTWAGGLTAATPDDVFANARALVSYMHAQLDLRAGGDHVGDDLLSRLVAARATADDALSDQELVSLSLGILTAGHRTTANLIRTGMYLLLSRPERFESLSRDRSDQHIGDIVEEVLRHTGPAEFGVPRLCTEDLEVGATRIAAGEVVLVVLASGNRDPRRFVRPDELDPGRRDNAHLAFGHGVHYCLGARLARLMGTVAFGRLAARVPSLRPAEALTGADLRAGPGGAPAPLPVLITDPTELEHRP